MAATPTDSHHALSANLVPLRRRSACSAMKRSNWSRAGWAMTGLIGNASGVQSGKSEARTHADGPPTSVHFGSRCPSMAAA